MEVVQLTGMSTMTINKPSIWKAVLIAPLGVPLAIVLEIAGEAVLNFGFSGLRDLPAIVLLVFLFGLPISYGAMLLLGLPYLIWLRSKGWLTWTFVCTGSIILGVIIWAGFWQFSLHPPSLTRTVPVGALAGFIVGAIFSLSAKLPR